MSHSNQIADPLDRFVRDSFAVIRGITMLSGYVIKPINDSTCEMAYIVQVRCLPYRSRRVLSSVFTLTGFLCLMYRRRWMPRA